MAAVGHALVEGAKAVHTLSRGSQIFVECVLGSKRKAFLRRPEGWEQRAVEQQLDAAGRPECSLKELARLEGTSGGLGSSGSSNCQVVPQLSGSGRLRHRRPPREISAAC